MGGGGVKCLAQFCFACWRLKGVLPVWDLQETAKQTVILGFRV